MFFNRKRRRRFWAFLSIVMVAGNLAGIMTVYAAGAKMSEKEEKPVSEEAYLGYGYFNGTLAYLLNRKVQKLDEDMELIYNKHGVFDGYAYITRTLSMTPETECGLRRQSKGKTPPILFYSLDNLQITSNDIYTGIGFQNDKLIAQVFGAERPDKKRNMYGFDKRGKVVDITQKDELNSVFVFEAGTNRPVYEFVGGDYESFLWV